eukprot:c25389_g1_i1.p2 GENE.c25389_g1_i1~~c25389_g1_i1.p2  ORF type:complete len:176 (-),score=22.25 c25389_g1_i1:21-515(-)
MLRLSCLLLLACVVCGFNGIEGNTPTAHQTGEVAAASRYLFGATTTKCARHVICKSCVEDIHCGWCATSGLCHDGNVLGATFENCTMWEFSWCSGEPCVEHATCHACTSDPLCGWCQTTLTCTEGGPQGPMFGDCKAEGWYGEGCAGLPDSRIVHLQAAAEDEV